jgi:hypothetical protein
MAKAGGNKDSAMAGHLVKNGYPHGRRKGHTLADPMPSMQHVGSAAYRRRVAK